MATKKELEALLATVTAERDMLRARLDNGIAAFRAARAETESLRKQLAIAQNQLRGRQEPVPVVTQYTRRDGSVWEKVRIGNDARHRCIQRAAA